MAEGPWFQDPQYQNYWQHTSRIQKHSAEQVQLHEQYSAAHWRSVALGLHHENQMLHQMVQQLLGMSVQNVQEHHFVPEPQAEVKRKPKKETKNVAEEGFNYFEKKTLSDEAPNYASKVQSESGDSMEEYLKFVQETEKHRDKRDRERQLEEGTEQKKFNPSDEVVTDAILDRADDIATDFERLKKEMSDLYGKDALKVRK